MPAPRPAGDGEHADPSVGTAPRPERDDDATITELRALAIEVAAEAAELVRDRAASGPVMAGTKSSAVDLVTESDRAAEALVRQRLAAARPADAILGEEEGGRAGTSGLTWVIDPIDGTTNYVYGLDSYAVSIAVASGRPEPGSWELLAGCVHAPATGLVWSAGRGLGAHRGNERLQVRGDVPLATSLVGTGFAYEPDQRLAQARLLTHVLPQVRDIRRLGSAAVDLCLVAEGRLDAFYEQFLNPWDVAAGWLVATEAGGRVRQLPGAQPGHECTVAAAPALLSQLEHLLAGALQDPSVAP